jgi:serine/threonine protein phosphatase PrpC
MTAVSNHNNPPQHPSQQIQPQPGSQPLPASPAANVPLAVWGASDKGRQREGNEDAVYPHSGSDTFPFEPSPQHLIQKGQLLIIADGVGGAKAGHEASHWAIRVAVERYYDQVGPDLGANLRAAIEIANNSLYQYLQSTGTQEAGCTMAAAVIHRNTLHVANVGDSRVYLVRNGQINQLTRDHTLTQRKIDQGLIRPEQAKMDPDSNVLTRSIGAGPTVQVDLFPPLQLAQGDTVLLCSDGLTDMLEDTEIARLAASGSPKWAAQRLIAAANKRGGLDNVSVTIARVGGKQPPVEGGLLGGIRRSIKGMNWQQKIILLAGIVLVAAALSGMAALGWRMGDRQQTTETPPPAATVTAAPAVATPALATLPGTPQPTDIAPSGQPTSTPAPTVTSTPTQQPPTPTYTPTATATPEPTEPPPPEPEGGGGSGGGGGGEPPPPPAPEEKPPPPPPPPP